MRNQAARPASRHLGTAFIASISALATTLTAAPLPASAQSPYYFWDDAAPRSSYKPYRQRSSSAQARHSGEQRGRSRPSQAKPEKSERAEPAKDKSRHAAAQQPLLTVVSIADQKVTVYDSTGQIERASVSTGQAGHRTPTGIFSIIQKNRWHHSNIYSGAPMPYMQRITWSGVAMHQGVLPGYPASHGCIRMPQSFAEKLFGMTKLGMRVVVSQDSTSAQQFAHDRLPVPSFQPAPSQVSDATPSVSDPASGSQVVKVADASGAEPSAPPGRTLSPMERALAAKAKAVANVGITAAAAKAALETAAERSAAATEALSRLRGAEAAFANATADLEAATRAIDQATPPEGVEKAKAARAEIEARLAEAGKTLSAARIEEESRRSDAFAAAQAARDAERAADAASDTAKASAKWTETISVFVSKKEGRVFVRQGFVPIHVAPVTIKNPEAPIGTHLYVAMDAPDAGKQLKWLAVTVPNNGVASERAAPSRRKKGEPEEAPHSTRPSESASGALERVEMPEDVRKLIADKLWPGASLIISDYGISNEQGEGATTDFIVLTR